MANKTDPGSISALIGAAVESDPKLRSRISAIIDAVISHVEYTLLWGTPQDKAILMRAVIPAMMKALQRTEEDETTRKQREAYARILESLTAGKK